MKNKDIKARPSSETIMVLILACIIIFMVFDQVYFLWIAVTLGVLGILSRRVAGIIHLAWHRLGQALGFVTGNIILSIVYICFVLPVGLVFRRKFSINLKRRSGSYFHDRDHQYQKQDLEKPW